MHIGGQSASKVRLSAYPLQQANVFQADKWSGITMETKADKLKWITEKLKPLQFAKSE